jgi:hypothetical protein
VTFDPLGHFNLNAPVDPKILAKAKALFESLPEIPSGLIARCYLHWTVGPLGMCFADYNAEALYTGSDWALKITHDPRDNAPGLNGNAEASHTYMRNTGAVGIAITGMDGADPNDFGPDGVTVTGLTHLCAAGAAFAKKYGIDTLGLSSGSPYGGEPNILTHAEAANRCGNPFQYSAYGPAPIGDVERWDLSIFQPLPEGVALTNDMANTCGNALRQMTHAYKVALG